MTEEEKKELIDKQNEEKVIQIKLFDDNYKQAPKIEFNTNIFKNVKFAMPEEEVKAD